MTGAVIATLVAVAAHSLGVQDLIRIPDLALFLPAAVMGGILGPTRLRPLLWIAAFPIAIVVLIVVYTPLVSMLAEPLVRRDALPPRVDAIAALSNGVALDGRMRSTTLDRVLSGLDLARMGAASTVLVSEERHRRGGRLVSDSADLRDIAARFGSSAEVIFVDSVFSTRTEALQMRRVAWPRGWRTVAVVTAPLHSRRACATFEAVGFRVVCAPAVSRDNVVPGAQTPRDRLRTFRSWLYETFATAAYKSNGWIR
jgi:uncharacterized SAM-binding protein YcdF (DUF218 family)